MNWINAPESVRRFSLQQSLQHAGALLLGVALAGSALFPAGWAGAHRLLGIAASALFALHLFSLLVIGVRHDVEVEQIAFLPVSDRRGETAKYARPEKWDYFLVLAWSLLVVSTGLVLSWPGKFGVPGARALGWVRIAHVAAGAGWLVHLLGCHVPFRFVLAPEGMRWSIFSGKVPLAAVEARAGWVRALVSSGVLVPVPVEPEAESQKETAQVRQLLDEGNRLTRESQFEAASAAFEAALALYPEYSQARFNLAVARMKQGEAGMAAEQFRTFLETDPFNPMAGKARELLEGLLKVDEGGDL